MNVRKQEDTQRIGAEEALVRFFEDDCPHDDVITLLERCFRTSINVKLLSEEWARLDFALDAISFRKGDVVIDQRLLLQQRETGENLLYAASLLRSDLLPPEMRPGQQTHQMQPFGTLLHAVSTRQTLLACERQPAGLSEMAYFALELHAPCLARTLLYSLDVPFLLVHEIIPLRTSR